jgi:hypothetical protein
MTLMEAYEAALRIFEQQATSPQTAGTFVYRNQMRRVDDKPVRVAKVTKHREKRHVFKDGTVWVACAATECYAGKINPETGAVRKKHSDGSPLGAYPSLSHAEPEIEVSAPDETQELEVPTFGHDTGECDDVDEVDERTVVEREEDEGIDEDDDTATQPTSAERRVTIA